MDIISRLTKKNLKVWLPLLPGVEGSPEIECLYCDQKEYDDAEKEATEIRVVNGREIETRDKQKFRGIIARKVVKDWRNMEQGDEPFPCTPENIDYLMEHSTEFRVLIMGVPMSMAQMLQAEKEALRKN